MSSDLVIKTDNLAKSFKMGRLAVQVLRGISLCIPRGAFCALMGPSGSGKSTLLHLLGLLDTPTEGKVYFSGEDTAYWSEGRRSRTRLSRIGFAFQFFNLLPELTAVENVMLRLLLSGHPNPRDRARELLSSVAIEGERFRHRPAELSGGQQQRVAIARALANDPEVLLLDEPTGDLDLETGREVVSLLQRLNRERGQTIIMATHDPQMAKAANRIIRIRDGAVVDDALQA